MSFLSHAWIHIASPIIKTENSPVIVKISLIIPSETCAHTPSPSTTPSGPNPEQRLVCSPSLSFLSVRECYMIGIIHRVTFSDWFLSLSIITLGSTQVVFIDNLSLFMLSNILTYGYVLSRKFWLFLALGYYQKSCCDWYIGFCFDECKFPFLWGKGHECDSWVLRKMPI